MAAHASRTAVITGGAGFIGSHVCDAFLAAGYEVVAIDDLSAGKRDNVPRGVELRELDVVDATRLEQAMREVNPTVVAHLAAQASVTTSVEDPAHDLEVNVRGTLNVLRAAAELGAPTVFASTGGALYGDRAPSPTPEHAAPEPLAPYAASKLAAEAYVGTWTRMHGLPNVSLRPGNVYGPRQSSKGEAGVVAIFADHLLRGEAPTVFGDGTQTRDYVHVHDVARAFVTVAESGVPGTYNVGCGQETSVLEILDALQRAAGTSIAPTFEPLRPGELLRSCLDSSLLRQRLGWEPRVELDAGLRETLHAYAP